MPRIAVVGAGRWGRLHAEKLAAIPGVRITAIVDRRLDRARAVACAFPGCVAAACVYDLPRAVDAATVVVDLPALADVAERLLYRGCHVLVEKPGGAHAEEALRLDRVARARKRLLVVGFVERFHPALDGLVLPARHVELRRAGPRRPEAGPVHLDWLTHDLDLTRRLIGEPLEVLAVRWGGDERLSVRLEGPGGRGAHIWVARGEEAVHRCACIDGRSFDLGRGAGDPLEAQMRAFVHAVRGGARGRLAGALDAVAALRLAALIAPDAAAAA